MKLNDWLQRERMTKGELSMRLNINRCMISLWKRGVRRIGYKTLNALSKLTHGEVNSADDVK